ncbi:MLO-like protein 12 [Abrus precatorius]|uniref:MLO-like protein n=1 Tax=Abrus precatorius TaxID=3816 RepID=A0A8B8KXU8_ABRPR|nr:MLO-like protein 12 [Abrus precatorius]
MDIGEERSLEHTPTWAISIFCCFFLIISIIIDGGLHKLTELLRKRKRKSLGKALTKTKTEMMKFGFMSFLLTILKVPISKICINKAVANSFLPCKDSVNSTGLTSPSATPNQVNYCEARGMVSLVSSDGILQLNIFISFLAVFHILFCTLTMCLGKAKMRRWEKWEDETRTLEYRMTNDSRRFQYIGQTLVGKRHLKFWSNYCPLLWMVCFIRQFYGSVTKDDYFTLRNGFIAANISVGSNFNFKKFLSRSYDEDFEKVVGIRLWIWIFSVLFIFLTAHVFYNYYWLPFIPLVVALLAGTKLQVVITKMCVDSCKENPVIKGTLLVRPNDDYFWFHRPEWLLHLLKFILIQNSFQLAFFTWTWYEFGPRSCFNREKEDIAIRIAMGVAVQLLCGYVTLPLYALVTQMGSGMKKSILTEGVSQGLKNWHKRTKQYLSKNNSTSSRHSDSLRSKVSENSKRGLRERMHIPDNMVIMSHPSPTTFGSGKVEKRITPTYEEEISSHSTLEITTTEEENRKIITRGTYDGEISFGSSWKNVGSSRGIGEVSSITEDDAEKLP